MKTFLMSMAALIWSSRGAMLMEKDEHAKEIGRKHYDHAIFCQLSAGCLKEPIPILIHAKTERKRYLEESCGERQDTEEQPLYVRSDRQVV